MWFIKCLPVSSCFKVYSHFMARYFQFETCFKIQKQKILYDQFSILPLLETTTPTTRTRTPRPTTTGAPTTTTAEPTTTEGNIYWQEFTCIDDKFPFSSYKMAWYSEFHSPWFNHARIPSSLLQFRKRQLLQQRFRPLHLHLPLPKRQP